MRCAVGCGHIHRGSDVGNGVADARGDAAHPVNNGLACKRGIEESKNPGGEWLTQPMVRQDGELKSTTWDVAMFTAIQGIKDAIQDNPDGLGVIGSGQQTNEAAYSLGKLARGGVGTRFYDANTTLCMASAVNAYYDAFGSDAPPCTYDDIPDAETHIVWGANPAVAHPVMFQWIEGSTRDDDSEMIVVDPVESETADHADVHVAPDLGSDLALARAILAYVIETDRVDEEFVESATEGFDALVSDLPEPAAAAESAGVSMEAVKRLAESLESDTLIYWGMGVNQSVQGTDTAGALIDMCLATGNMGPGTGPFSLTGQSNSMGTRVCSSKGSWPGQRDFDDPHHRSVMADAWDIPVDRLPDDSGPGPEGMYEGMDTGPVEAVYAVATNPVAGAPDATNVERILDETFLVVQDSHKTKTTELADVVLPAATWGESEGTAINMERTVSRVRAATDLPSGVRSDLDIITSLGNALCEGLFPETDPEAIFDELTALTEGTLADCSGISYERLEDELAVRWPAPDEDAHAGYRYYNNGDWSFPTPSGKARFANGTGRELPEPPDEEYPLTLTTAREKDGYNTGVRSRDSPDEPGDLVARVHPDTIASKLNPFDDGSPQVRLESRRGSVTATVESDPAIPEGVVWLPIHHPKTNDLTIPAADPQSTEPNLKQCAVRLVKQDQAVAVPGGETA
jgi:assimilatory nitrate reductase catalytic subunit